jgi:hypothetical protein
MQTESISGSKPDEFTILREALSLYARRPNMYGYPEELEGLGKHVTHVLLTTLHSAWRLEETEAFWRQVASDLGFGERCAQDEEEHRIRRWNRWGANEDVSRAQVVAAYKRIWTELRPLAQDLPRTKEWIETLLNDPVCAGPPDVLDNVLVCLIVIASEPCIEIFDALYEKEKRRVKGDSVRRLPDIGTKKNWHARSPGRHIEFKSYPHVVAGIQEALRRLDMMQRQHVELNKPAP